MTYEVRNPIDFNFGTLTSAAAVSDTTVSSAEFSTLSSGYNTGNYFPIILLNPSAKTHEKCWIVGHTAASNDVTVVRGRESTAAQAWPSGTQWVTGPTTRDGLHPSSSVSLPTDPHIGMRGLMIDQLDVRERTYTQGWIGSVRASKEDMGRSTNGTTSHPTGRVPQMKMWTAAGTTNGSGILSAPIPNGGFATLLISAVATRLGVASAYVPTIDNSSTITNLFILCSNTGTGVVTGASVAVCLLAIGY